MSLSFALTLPLSSSPSSTRHTSYVTPRVPTTCSHASPPIRKRTRTLPPPSSSSLDAAIHAQTLTILPSLIRRDLDTLSFGSIARALHALCRAGEWASVIEVYDLACSQPQVHRHFSARTYTDVFLALMKTTSRKYALRAFDVWQNIDAANQTQRLIGPKSFNFIYVALSRAGFIEEAKSVREACVACGYYLNRYSYNCFLNACSKLGKIDEAFDTLRAMAENGVSPDVVSFNMLISCCVRTGDLDVALSTLSRMRDWGIRPDIYSYNSVVNGLRKKGMLDEAFELVAQMERDSEAPSDATKGAVVETQMGVSPDLVTYNTLLSGIACSGNPDLKRAMRVKRHIEKRGLSCNEVTYNALMAVAAKTDETGSAFDIYDEMIGRNLKPNCECFTTLITLCGRSGMLDRALRMHQNMIASGIQANVITFNALLTACRTNDKRAGDEALKIVQRMQHCGVQPDVITFSTVIDALGRCGRIAEMYGVRDEMVAKGIRPNLVTYTSMISALTKTGDLRTALKMLTEMEECGIQPNVYTFSSLINGAGKVGEIDMALAMVGMMRERGIVASRVTYLTLFQMAYREGDVVVQRVLKEIEYDRRIGERGVQRLKHVVDIGGGLKQLSGTLGEVMGKWAR